MGCGGVFYEFWRQGLLAHEALRRIDWKRPALDGAMGKALLGGQKTGPNPTDRAQKGTKKSLLTDGRGMPLGLAVALANVNDYKLMRPTLKSIIAAVVRLHDSLASRAVSYQPAAREFYNLAFRPLVPLLGKAQRLFISPDGQLAFAPFAALHDGRRFLVDAWDITYLTSGKDLLRRFEDLTPARSVVVPAAPDFNSPPATSSFVAQATPNARSAPLERFFSTIHSGRANPSWLPLPGTHKEAESIQRLLPQARLLLGPAATKDALLNLETPGLLHIATHGFFLEDSSAAEATRTVIQPSLFDSGPAQRPADPLLRSGLSR